MVMEGLSMAKGQCAFIPRGGKLTYQREYTGTIALAKRVSDFTDVHANVIYEGDVFEYSIDQTGVITIVKHEQKLGNVNPQKILGAYAVVIREGDRTEATVMTYAEIKTAWAMGEGMSKAHTQFPAEMCKKTVIGRALKLLVRSSDDADLAPEETSKVYTEPVEFQDEPEEEAVVVESEEPAEEPPY